jgi:hypothetical protein
MTMPPTRRRPVRTTHAAERSVATSQLTADLSAHRRAPKLELAERTLERTWLFLERGDARSSTAAVPAPAAT